MLQLWLLLCVNRFTQAFPELMYTTDLPFIKVNANANAMEGKQWGSIYTYPYVRHFSIFYNGLINMSTKKPGFTWIGMSNVWTAHYT